MVRKRYNNLNSEEFKRVGSFVHFFFFTLGDTYLDFKYYPTDKYSMSRCAMRGNDR